MLQETIQLEKLRQQIEDAEYEIGNQLDYLDRGKPNASQQKKAAETISRLQSHSKKLKSKLHDLILSVRRDKPEAVAEWGKLHKDILERILREKSTVSRNAVARQNVARSTLNQWEQVLDGKQEYVNINWHFLKDYKAEVRKLVANKNWWEFWK